MTNYLPLSEDELEKSDEAIDDNKGQRKKKKRSASLQGTCLVARYKMPCSKE